MAPNNPNFGAGAARGTGVLATGYSGRGAKGGKGAKAPATRPGPNPYSSALYQPTQSLSGKQLAQAAQQIANLQVQGPINDLRGQLSANNKASAQEQKVDFGYYMQLAQAAKDAVASENQTGQQLQGTLQGIGQGTQAQLGQLGQQSTGGTLGRMAALGLDAGQTGLLQAESARQQGTAALNSQTAQNFGATQSANLSGQASADQAAGSLRGTEQIGGLARATTLANQPINQKIADEQSQRGALTATALGQLRSAERNYQVAEQGLASTAQTNAAKLSLQQAQDRANNVLKARGQDLTFQAEQGRIKAILSGQSVTSQNDLANQANNAAQLAEKTRNDAATQAWRSAALIAKGNGKGGNLTLGQQNTIFKQLDEVSNAITRLQQGGIKNSKGKVTIANPNAQQIKSLLGQGYNSTLIEAAYELDGWGALLPSTANALQRMGVQVQNGSFRGKPLQVKARPAVSVSAKTIGGLL